MHGSVQVYRRRVQLVGGSSLVVSLPKSWAREVGLGAGKEVVIEVLPDKTLRLYPSGRIEKQLQTYEIDVATEPDANVIVRRVMAGYVAGYTTIKLKGLSKAPQKAVENALSLLRSKTIGLEVMDEDLDNLTLQCIVDTSFARVRDVVKRLVRVALSMHEDMLQCLKDTNNCTSITSGIRERDDIADKLYLLLLRQLVNIVANPEEASRQQVTPAEALFLALIAKNIERIADYATNIAKIVSSASKVKLGEDILKLYEETIQLLRDTAEILFRGSSTAKAIDLLARADGIKAKLANTRNTYTNAAPPVRLILETISRLLGHTMDILEAVMDIDALRTLQNTEENNS